MKEYELYVPLKSKDDQIFPAKELKALKERLVSQFGGVTPDHWNLRNAVAGAVDPLRNFC